MKTQDHSETKLDIYLLAGQSNASGHSKIELAGEGERDHHIYENVRYYWLWKNADGTVPVDHSDYGPVREDLGTPGCIGPELGMARVLNPLYDGVKNEALILKSAAGGTTLMMHEDHLGNRYFFRDSMPLTEDRYHHRGSWFPMVLCPPPMQRFIGEHPDHPTGFLFREFKESVRKVFRELREAGYQSKNVRFQALIWMQGESDRLWPEPYEEAFPVFVKEIREFLSLMTGEDYTALPVIIGEISETFHSAKPGTVEENLAFIRMQHRLAETITHCQTLRTGAFPINKLENGVSVTAGNDLYHWRYADMLKIGEMFGEAAYHCKEENDKKAAESGNDLSDEGIQDPVLLAPMKEPPCYAFDHEPAVAELRETAVRAMRDMLSVQWYTPVSFAYRKSGAAAGKTYLFRKGECYAGLPYTDVNASLFGMLEYLDRDGRLKTEEIESIDYPTLGQAVNRTIGNTCSGSTGFGLFSVCNSIKSNLVSYTLTVKNGFYPVGDYAYDFTIDEFAQRDVEETVTTVKICQKYGEEKMFECYACALPGDLVDLQGDDRSKGHSMMVIQPAKVVRNADGTINAEESVIVTQDQRTGGNHFPTGPDGADYTYSGRIYHDNTFRWLFDQGYIPVTTAELLGKKKYEKAWARLGGNESAPFKERTAESNYPMTVLKILQKTASGTEKRVRMHIFNRSEVGRRLAFDYPLAELFGDGKEPLGAGKYRLVAILTTGEHFTLAEWEA